MIEKTLLYLQSLFGSTLMVNTKEWILEYFIQRIGKLILIIDRGFSKTVLCINILINHNEDSCKILIKDSDNKMIWCAPTINTYWLYSTIFVILA
jgi:hypothetical protein